VFEKFDCFDFRQTGIKKSQQKLGIWTVIRETLNKIKRLRLHTLASGLMKLDKLEKTPFKAKERRFSKRMGYFTKSRRMGNHDAR
jgi:hypothetical protein